MSAKRSEVAVAKPVVAWLTAQGWTVFQEVKPPRGCSGIADIVATRGPLVWIVETKTTLTFAVIEQADEWRGWAHLRSVATPAVLTSASGRRLAKRVLEWLGIGLLDVGAIGGVRQDVAPAIDRRPVHLAALRSCLREEHKTFAEAGSPNGAVWSPWRATVKELMHVLHENGGVMPMKAAVDAIRHHYASDAVARSVLTRDAEYGRLPGVEFDRSVRPAVLRLTKAQEPLL